MTDVRRAFVFGGDDFVGAAGQLGTDVAFTAAIAVDAAAPAAADETLFGNSDEATDGWFIERLTDPSDGVARYQVTVFETVGGAITGVADLVQSQFAAGKVALISFSYDQAVGLDVYINGNLADQTATGGNYIPGAGAPTLHMDQVLNRFMSAGYISSATTAAEQMGLAGGLLASNEFVNAFEHRYSATFSSLRVTQGQSLTWEDTGTLAATAPINLTRADGADGVLTADIPRYG